MREPRGDSAGASGAGATSGSATDPHLDVDRNEALGLYFALAVSRAADARLDALADEGRVPLAPLRPPLREAGVVGAAHALRRRDGGTGDVLAPTRRAAGALRLFGMGLNEFFQDHLAGDVGSVHGETTELHRVDLQAGILAPVAPLGTVVEVMAGVTLAFRLRGEDRVGVVFDSDRASSTGAWHEGVVFAAARRCPMVLVVETTPSDAGFARPRDSRLSSYTQKGPGYGIPAVSVDGADVLAVVHAVRTAADLARGGSGVHMVEIRYGEGVAANDPLLRLRALLLEREAVTAAELDDLEREAGDRCEAAVERVLSAPLPDRPERRPGGLVGDRPLDVRRRWASDHAPQAM